MPTDRRADVSAVVVHFGPIAATERVLESLRRHAPGMPVVVVDNDGLFAKLHPADDSETLEILSPGKNLGYGAACNLGARHTTGDFLLLLNNDTALDAGTVSALVAALDSEPRLAAVGPRLRDGSDKPIRSIGRAPTPRRILFENLFLPRLFPGV